MERPRLQGAEAGPAPAGGGTQRGGSGRAGVVVGPEDPGLTELEPGQLGRRGHDRAARCRESCGGSLKVAAEAVGLGQDPLEGGQVATGGHVASAIAVPSSSHSRAVRVLPLSSAAQPTSPVQ